MKILLWIGGQANQKALANKIGSRFPIAGMVIERPVHKRRMTLGRIFQAMIDRTMMSSLIKAWKNLLDEYNSRYPSYPATEILEVENINSDEAYEFSKILQADLIIVSGTRLVRKKMLSVPAGVGILNLHTGLSPYVKGGPNCTNWCLSTGNFHLIGNTIMWIDAGIDSGNILSTEFTNFDGSEDLDLIHRKVMEHAHDLYLRSIEFLKNGKTQSVPQDSVATGKTYYNREWTWSKKRQAIKNVKRFQREVKNGSVEEKRKAVRVVGLGRE